MSLEEGGERTEGGENGQSEGRDKGRSGEKLSFIDNMMIISTVVRRPLRKHVKAGASFKKIFLRMRI